MPVRARDGAEEQVLLDGQRPEDVPALGHQCDPAARDRLGREPADRLAEIGDLARHDGDEPEDGRERRRLAGPVRPDEATISPSPTSRLTP